jgi:hemoglobin-like flavoprotein
MKSGIVMSDQVGVFRASLKRCLAAPHFLGSFYDDFVASSEEVQEKFRKTDLDRQAKMLADSLYTLAVAAQAKPGTNPAWAEMPRLAARHSRADLDIKPHLYDHWLNCLLDAVRRHDPECSAEVEEAWRKTLSAGIEYMRSRY